jgi:23S rRNA pseudouridine1911/1915/1917 synthase
LKVVFEDEHLVVVDKPAGMIVNNALSVKEPTVQDWLKPKLVVGNLQLVNNEFVNKGGVVHRLDKDTSGLIVLAKTEESYFGLKEQFLARKVKKTYVALVNGRMMEESGTVAKPIERHTKNKFKFSVSDNLARMAITHWKVLQQYKKDDNEYCFLELSPLTGRTHQLRVHMQHLGHPIVSDPIYGFRKNIKKELQLCPRLFLHAKSLEFVHPITGATIRLSANLPKELSDCLDNFLLH